MKRFLSVFSTVFLFVNGFAVREASAQAISVNTATSLASASVGSVTNLAQVFIFGFNLLRYLGWAGVIIGVGLAIFSLIYKLMNTDSDEVMKTVQGNLTKAVIIVLAGILLISAGFIMTIVGNLFGLNLAFELDRRSISL